MIETIIKDAEQRMEKSLSSLELAFNKIRTGRAHPSLLDTVVVSYYGADTPLNQLANITEETRKEYTKQAKAEAENARVAVRNIRRDANGSIKDLVKDKEISEDDQRRAEERIQKITDKYIASVDSHYAAKETDLLSI